MDSYVHEFHMYQDVANGWQCYMYYWKSLREISNREDRCVKAAHKSEGVVGHIPHIISSSLIWSDLFFKQRYRSEMIFHTSAYPF